MAVGAYLVAGSAAAVVTSIQLWFVHGRLPIGKGALKSATWWALLVGLDLAAACLAIVGLAPTGQLDTGGAAGFTRSALVGVLAPLALRSPVRQTEVSGTTQPVGITYVYDVVRLQVDLALDERLTRLRRRDTALLVKILEKRGWTSDALTLEIRRHLAERRKFDDNAAAKVHQSVENSLTLPTESERIEGLVTTLLVARMRALLDDLTSVGPKPIEVGDDEDEEEEHETTTAVHDDNGDLSDE